MTFDFLREKVGEIERLLETTDERGLEDICAAALQIVLRAPSGYISQTASTVATSARLWREEPSKRDLYERPLRSAVANLRRSLEAGSPD